MSKVEEYNLVDITSGIHTGLNPRKNFKLNTLDAKFYYVTVKEIASNKVIFSENTDRINSDAWNVIQNRSHLSKGDILFSGIGTIGKVAYVNEDPNNWNCSESVYVIKPFNGLSGKYLYYVLQTNKIIKQYEANSAGSIMKGVRKANLEQLRIPLPHIKVQEEIVKILDSFTNLIDALNEELSLRQKQFEYYREKLLTFDKNAHKKRIIDLLIQPITDGPHETPTFVEKGIPFISAEAIVDNKINFSKKRGFISNEYNDLCCKKYKPKVGDVYMVKSGSTVGKVAILEDKMHFNIWSPLAALRVNDSCLPKYLYYLLLSRNIQEQIKQKCSKGSQPNLSMRVLERFEINVVNYRIQQSIVEKLDAFESLIASLKEEISLRQKQYEYYREKLLTFD